MAASSSRKRSFDSSNESDDSSVEPQSLVSGGSFSSTRGATDSISKEQTKLIKEIRHMDEHSLFNLVPTMPNYNNFISNPMCFDIILNNITAGKYIHNLKQFKTDVDTIWNNAEIFNGIEHGVTKIARELESIFNKKFSSKFENNDSQDPAKKSKIVDSRQFSSFKKTCNSNFEQFQNELDSMKQYYDNLFKQQEDQIAKIKKTCVSMQLYYDSLVKYKTLENKLTKQLQSHQLQIKAQQLKYIPRLLKDILKNVKLMNIITDEIKSSVQESVVQYLNEPYCQPPTIDIDDSTDQTSSASSASSSSHVTPTPVSTISDAPLTRVQHFIINYQLIKIKAIVKDPFKSNIRKFMEKHISSTLNYDKLQCEYGSEINQLLQSNIKDLIVKMQPELIKSITSDIIKEHLPSHTIAQIKDDISKQITTLVGGAIQNGLAESL